MEGPLERPVPIYFSAIGPKMIALAARIADGVVTNSITEEGYERYQTIIRRESEAVGRDPEDVKLYSLTMMAVEDDISMDVVRRALTFFFSSTHYYPMMEVSGYGEQALRIQQAWRTGDFVGASRLVTDAMVEKFAVVGSAAQRKQKLRWMLDCGIYPILYPIWRPGHAVDDYLEIIRLASRYLVEEKDTIPSTL
jgi:alkanesulfonate monooxygenase SsuD/methylene tetrahydromethanopterin reductase-like flavin-dependent oxidoreductase (luciferase family)